jgi:H+-transporting ATPase
MATILGLMGVFATFLLFWIAERLLHLDRPTIQTLIFLKLAVAGHMTIYLTRTGENSFWTRPFPSPILLIATETTQIIGTFIAVYGIFMSPIGWKLAILIWIYALIFLVINNVVKVHVFRILNHKGLIFRR